MVLTVRVESVEFQAFTTRLRVRGVVVEGPERFGVKGKHHTLSISPGQEVIIVKPRGWTQSMLERLEKASAAPPVLVIAVDYDEYAIAIVKGQGVKILVEESLNLPGKDDPRREEELKKALTIIAKNVANILGREKPVGVLVVGPGHLKNELASRISTSVKVGVYTDNTSMGGVAGVYEALRRGSVRRIASKAMSIIAEQVLEEFEKLLAKSPDRVAYSLDRVELAVNECAVDTLLVLDEIVHDPDPSKRQRIINLLYKADECRSKIVFTSLESPAGKRVKLLGGLIAVLRYPIPLESRVSSDSS